MENFTANYIKKLTALLTSVDTSVVREIIEAFEKTHNSKGCIYFIGNGGSAATASHFATDIGTGLRLRYIRNFNVRCLSDSISTVTAISNDIGYENIFYAQIKDRLTNNDVVVAISASGNSPNIVKAVEYAKTQSALIVGCTGFDGGKLKEFSDICFHVETEKGEYGLVEDIHMILDHMIYSYYISLKEESATRYEME